jgi:hypothetical protein
MFNFGAERSSNGSSAPKDGGELKFNLTRY